jgi:hypothetical protein
METLEERLRRVEDVLAIGQLRAKYCTYLDAGEWEALADLFTADGEFHGIGSAVGRAELIEFYDRVRRESIEAWWHFSTNETVELDGDRATGETYLDQPCVIDGVAYASAGRYRDEFAREDGRWLFAKRTVTFFYFVPLAEGWQPGHIAPERARQALDELYR